MGPAQDRPSGQQRETKGSPDPLRSSSPMGLAVRTAQDHLPIQPRGSHGSGSPDPLRSSSPSGASLQPAQDRLFSFSGPQPAQDRLTVRTLRGSSHLAPSLQPAQDRLSVQLGGSRGSPNPSSGS